MNVFNSYSLAYFREKGLKSACLSFELRFAQLRDMEKTYRQMAQKALPLAPQLAPRRQEGEPENGQFII